MNNNKRKKLKVALDFLLKAKDVTAEVRDQEEEDMNNLQDSFCGTIRYESMETAIGYLDDAVSAMEEAVEYIEEASE